MVLCALGVKETMLSHVEAATYGRTVNRVDDLSVMTSWVGAMGRICLTCPYPDCRISIAKTPQ